MGLDNHSKNKLDSILFAMLGNNELVEKWWDSPNKAFDMITPKEMLDLNHECVVNYILNHAFGGAYL
jgi:hypothetical protein